MGGFDVYVDVESLQAHGDIREFWNKYIYKQEQEQEGKKFIEKRVYGRVNCAENTRQYITVVGYSGNGERVFRYDVSPEWVSIASDSKGEEVLKFACGPPIPTKK